MSLIFPSELSTSEILQKKLFGAQMKLSELIFAVSIFLISCAVFSASLINVRRGVNKAEGFSKNAVALLDTDALIRKEIKKIAKQQTAAQTNSQQLFVDNGVQM